MSALTNNLFGKVAVLMGGRSAEREISLISGQNVLDALLAQNIDADKVDVACNVAKQLTDGQFDRAFVMLHGRCGEDGEIQGLLQSMGIPFTGSDVTGAVLSMNKVVSKQIWRQQGLPTAEHKIVTNNSNVETVIAQLGLPLITKPVNEGSSIGMAKVSSIDELTKAIEVASEFDTEIMVEGWIDGPEYTAAILNSDVLPIIRLQTPNEFYDFDAKYKDNTTQYLCPCGLSEGDEVYCKKLAETAFKALRMSGWGRIDLMRDQKGQFYLLEANSVPGMTDHSLVPMAAAHAGISFKSLVWQILAQTIEVQS